MQLPSQVEVQPRQAPGGGAAHASNGNGNGNGNGTTAPQAPAAAATAATAATALSMTDWNDLLDAVKDRLRLSLHPLTLDDDASTRSSRMQKLQDGVLECVAALDQLHVSLRQELGRRQQLELEVFETQTALAQAHAKLAGTQAGERHARQLAAHDALTSLPNRQMFRERLAHALDPGGRTPGDVAVLLLDLDDFKPINELHGHAVGDEVLRIVAMRLKRAMRADDLLSRMGGDEFACLVGDRMDRSQLARLACKLFDTVSEPLCIGDLRLSITPSIGIAMPQGAPTTADALLQRADAAMTRAKRERSGVALFEGDA